MAWAVRQTAAENALADLAKSVEYLSDNQIGALFVLEGNQPLSDVIETGIPINGQLTSELLLTIFYQENPLHDGAVVIREDQIVAASCVLPLTERTLYTKRRLGTRHRAAVGMSEASDALIVVVSEETGDISTAFEGKLRLCPNSTVLRERLFDFYIPSEPRTPSLSLWRIIKRLGRRLMHPRRSPSLGQFMGSLGLFFVSVILAFVAWFYVAEQNDPSRQARVEAIPLRVEGVPEGTMLVNPPPSSVSALVQTTDSVLNTLRPSSFQAIISLENLQPDLYHLPIEVTPVAPQVRVLAVEPSAIDLE
jgi:hypothetical protein